MNVSFGVENAWQIFFNKRLVLDTPTISQNVVKMRNFEFGKFWTVMEFPNSLCLDRKLI